MRGWAERRSVIGLALWGGVWWLPWQPLLADWPGLRAAVGLLAVALPGAAVQRLLGGGGDPVRVLTVGLLTSTALAGALGVLGSAVQVPFSLVTAAFWAIGAVLLPAALQQPLRRETLDGRSWLLLAPALVAAGLLAWFALSPRTDGDNYTYLAMITEVGHGDRLRFTEFLFGTERPLASRFWIAFWPLTLAMIGRSAGLDALPLTALYLGPLLAACTAAAVYGLARALGFSPRLAGLAVVAHGRACCGSPAAIRPGRSSSPACARTRSRRPSSSPRCSGGWSLNICARPRGRARRSPPSAESGSCSRTRPCSPSPG